MKKLLPLLITLLFNPFLIAENDPFEEIKTKDIEDFAELFDVPPPSSDKEAFEMTKKIRKWITDGRPK